MRAGPAALEGPEQVLLDVARTRAATTTTTSAALEVSPDNRLLAYAEDTVGRRQYTLRFKELETGGTLPDAIPNVEEAVAWAADNRRVLYIEKDPVRPCSGSACACTCSAPIRRRDPVVYEEADETFYVDVGMTKDGRYL